MSHATSNGLPKAHVVIVKEYLEEFREADMKSRADIFTKAWKRIKVLSPDSTSKQQASAKKVCICSVPFNPSPSTWSGS
jgi:hypothetical protein